MGERNMQHESPRELELICIVRARFLNCESKSLQDKEKRRGLSVLCRRKIMNKCCIGRGSMVPALTECKVNWLVRSKYRDNGGWGDTRIRHGMETGWTRTRAVEKNWSATPAVFWVKYGYLY